MIFMIVFFRCLRCMEKMMIHRAKIDIYAGLN